jgi:oligopeptide/dipeptide ABC transporter ATP-binding protein
LQQVEGHTPGGCEGTDVVLRVSGLSKHFPIRKGIFRRQVATAKAVEQVDLFLRRGETLGIVGESGCGKSTLARLVLRLVEPSDGKIELQTKGDISEGIEHQNEMIDLTNMSGRALRRLRSQVQMIFQDPYLSLNPRMKIGSTLDEALTLHTDLNSAERRARIAELLQDVGLRPEMADRYPHEFSGGQRQRISIARALAVRPHIIVADEPVSALDVSVQAQVVKLLLDLQEKYHISYIFISHDLSVVKYLSERIAVMYLGEVLETGPTAEIFERPRHPYTEALMNAIPQIGVSINEENLLRGEIPSNIDPPKGCKFNGRCKYVQEICRTEAPPFWVGSSGRKSRCHFAESLELHPPSSV